jgi:hypothetical protein
MPQAYIPPDTLTCLRSVDSTPTLQSLTGQGGQADEHVTSEINTLATASQNVPVPQIQDRMLETAQLGIAFHMLNSRS